MAASLRLLVIGAMAGYAVQMADSFRSLYLVCYDVSCPKRLYRVHRFLLAYKVGGQKSFFECWLTAADLREVRQQLEALIEPTEDRVHIFQLDPRMKLEGLGLATVPKTDVFLIL